ncbi:hypothetical protein V6N11_002651 [Hibiscus sabdariffa]|uniref:BZIP domain-containing protein n=1 Tax=Hibiscus sabdariffa TaxID=183260 RepID=A0ABR2SB33_9ROSI
MLSCFECLQVDSSISVLCRKYQRGLNISHCCQCLSSMFPSNPPMSSTSFNHVDQEDYFMNQGDAGASSGGTKATFFPGLDPSVMRGEKNETDPNPFPPPAEKLTLGPSANTVVPNAVQGGGGCLNEQNMEQRKFKRIISNRLSAQRSRIKKIQYVHDMEKKVESLQTLVDVLSTQVKLQKEKQLLLRIEQQQLQSRISACANRGVMVDAEIEERRAELNRVRELLLTRQHQQMQSQSHSQNMGVWEHGHGLPTEPMLDDEVDGEEDGIAEEMNKLNQLNLHQESPGQMLMPGWEAGGELTNVGLHQSGPEHLQNPLLNPPQQQQIGSFDSDFGELEKIFNFNTGNDFQDN